jgi:hypothetical protein
MIQKHLGKMLIKENSRGIILMQKAEFYFAFSLYKRKSIPNNISHK